MWHNVVSGFSDNLRSITPVSTKEKDRESAVFLVEEKYDHYFVPKIRSPASPKPGTM